MSIDKLDYSSARSEKYCLWMNMPSHHQRDFIHALHIAGIDLQVRFYGKVDDRRKIMGWDSEPLLDQYSQYVKPSIDAVEESVPDWMNRIHIIPGTVGDKFLMSLVKHLIRKKIQWVHWSEDVKPGLNRLIRLPLRRLYGRKIKLYALGALAISNQAEKEFVSWGGPVKKIRWLPYAANPLTHSGNVDDKIKMFIQNRFAFMFSGALCQRKGTDLLLKAFKIISDRYQNAVLILIGPDTPDDYYHKFSEKIGIPKDRVLFRGPISYTQMGNVLPLCDVFVLPSRYDGWGMVIYEAASMEKAIIASDRCGATYHMIIDGLNGFRIKADSVGALSEAMEIYLTCPRLSKIHGIHSKVIAKLFHPRENVERFLGAMESFLTMKEKSEDTS